MIVGQLVDASGQLALPTQATGLDGRDVPLLVGNQWVARAAERAPMLTGRPRGLVRASGKMQPRRGRNTTRQGSDGMAGIERVSATDWAYLAADHGPVPGQIGALLHLAETGPAPEPAAIRCVLSARIPAIPRLRQRLAPTPLGCGGPVWLDDVAFDVARHVATVACPAPVTPQALLDLAVDAVLRRLPRDRPLWSVTLLTGPGHGVVAVVVVLHHALADGVGGLGILTRLVDEAPVRPGPEPAPDPSAEPGADAGADLAFPAATRAFPEPPPPWALLARDAARRRVRALREAPGTLRAFGASMRGAGGVHPPRAADTSLLQPTGSGRQARAVTVPRAPVREAAHALGGTANDAVVVAVARAVGAVLAARGEDVRELVVTVPVSGRTDDPAAVGGNLVSPVLVTVPTSADVATAVRAVAAQVRAHKDEASGPPPIALIGWAFRPLARLGGYRWYLRHQHRFHTLVGHVRGPGDVLHLAGVPVTAAVPLAVAEGGNTPLAFEVLSYAGALTLTAIADPDAFPELDLLAARLAEELQALAS